MKQILLFILVLAFGKVFAQPIQIRGSLKTSDGTPVSFASVTLIEKNNRIVAFDNSDSSGHFVLTIQDTKEVDSLDIRINHLGYEPINRSLTPLQNSYDMLMKERSIDLSEVKVKSRPRIDSRGDTLTYDVGSFAKGEDQSIGDVLKRMPGMKVSESGQIKYNGRSISNFYIDGDDLLSDKYSVGSKTIPHAIVKGVEVMQNHQPLKVLKNKVLSDQIAINLVIKDDATMSMSGQAKLGAGLPNQYDGELNAILFNKKYKMLNVLKGNNVGTNLGADFKSFDLSGRLSQMGNSRLGSLLSAGTVAEPPLPHKLHYFNNSGSLNANNLMNLKNGLQLKMNVNLLIDHNETQYESRNDIYFNQDTISYTEHQDINRSPFVTDVSFTAMANEDTYHFENVLKFAYSGGLERSSLLSNEIDIEQRLNNRIRDFSNTLTYTPALNNANVMNVSWYLNHYNHPQVLTIAPGINPDILNEGVDYASLRQFAEAPTWFNRITTEYLLTNKAIKQRYRVGVINERQHLKSSLRLQNESGYEQRYDGSDDNSLQWRRDRLFAEATYEYKKGRFETSVGIPLAAQQINYHDPAFNLSEQDLKMIFNPSLRAKLMTTVEDYLSLNYAFSNQMGNINGVFRGAVLTNYRNILANDAELEERRSHNLGLHYNYQRSINMLFMNAGFVYSRSTANTIASSQVTDAVTRTILLPFENDVSTLNATAGISKYIFSLGATTSLNVSWSTTRFNQYLNDELLPFNNLSLTVNPKTEMRIWDRISIHYDGSASWVTSKLVQDETLVDISDRQIRQLKQTIGVSYSPFKNTYIRLNGQHQYLNQQATADINYFFMSANLRYKFDKWRTDIELDLTNLANVTSYRTYSLSANHFTFSHYQLRGRMALLKFVFNL